MLVQIVCRSGIADVDVAHTVALGRRVEILLGLSIRVAEVAPGALLLEDQDIQVERVDEARAVVGLRRILLVAGDGSAADIEHLKEIVVEALRLALPLFRVPPILGEGHGAHRYLFGIGWSRARRPSLVPSISQISGSPLPSFTVAPRFELHPSRPPPAVAS